VTTDWYTYWKDRGGLLSSAHRPHSTWKDYRSAGIYLITIVTHARKRVFGELNRDIHNPGIALTNLGQYVEQAWLQTFDKQFARGRHIRSLGYQVMPDHFHGILQVVHPMDVPLGEIIRGFKMGCTQSYRLLYPPYMADEIDREYLARSSRKQREDYYAAHGIEPLFDDNFDDSICYRKGQLESIINYVQDNPRRALMRALYPDLFQRRQHISIDGQDFAAYGNLFLLKRPWKEQVFCHRWLMNGDRRDYNTRYETTDAFAQERAAWIQAAKDGAVLVTPGISKGEQQLVKDCIEQALPLIHLQKEPIREGWNPELRRHQLCEMGQLLILSPWQLTAMDDFNGVPADTDYSRFHNMNTLAARICSNSLRPTMHSARPALHNTPHNKASANLGGSSNTPQAIEHPSNLGGSSNTPQVIEHPSNLGGSNE